MPDKLEPIVIEVPSNMSKPDGYKVQLKVSSTSELRKLKYILEEYENDLAARELTPITKDVGDHMSLEKWLSCVESNGFIDYDGYGDLATDTHVSNLSVSPSDTYDDGWQEYTKYGFTHIVWYNR